MRLYNAPRTVLAALSLAGLSATALAEISPQPRPACDPSSMSCTPNAQPKPCVPQNCLADAAAQAQFEKENNCTFPASACGVFNQQTQCCGRDPRTGKPRVVDKIMSKPGVISPGLDSFTWTNYTLACPDKKQSEAPPDALWQKCKEGQKHSPEDDYKISEVRSNGGARSYCIDGCSVSPTGVAWALVANVFLVPDRNNPAGYPTSSLYSACVNHDVCYQTCDKDQNYCDKQLEQEAITVCQDIPANDVTEVMTQKGGMLMPISFNTRLKCEEAAVTFRFILNNLKLGKPAFNFRRQQYCQCC